MGKRTHEVNVAKSVDPLFIKGNTELPRSLGSVETLHDRAEMPKRKSGQQTLKRAVKVT